MPDNKKITDLDPSIPKGEYAFVAATGVDNFRVSYSDLAEYSSIGTKSGSFTQSLTISGVPVSTGAGGTVGGLPVVGGDNDNIDFGGTEPGDVRDINFQQGGENIMVINQDGDVNMQNDLYVSGGISGDIISGKTGVFTESLTISGFSVLTGVSADPVFKDLKSQVGLNSASSFVFFSDAINNLGATFKVYNPTPVADVYLSDVVVDFANNMKVSIRWDGPPDDYIGTGYINDIEIPISNITELGDKTRRFEGYLDNLDLAGETLISGSANGRTGYLNLFEIGVGILAEDISIAAVNTATPDAGSNLGTTHLKNGDTVNIEVVYDGGNFSHPLQVPASINIYNEDLAQQSTHTNLAWHVSALGAGFSGVTLPVVVSDRDGDLGVCIDSTNNAGIVAAKQCSTEFAGLNKTRPVDNVAPTISFGAVDYPPNQGALKSNETATVNHTIIDADTYSYSSDIGELNIVNPGAYEQAKSVSRINGGYNVSNNNFNITATKSTNGIIVSSATNIKIANTALQLSIPNLNGNIESGPTPGSTYNFNLNSDQIFNTSPSLSLDASQSPISSLTHSSQGTGPTSNSFQLIVNDTDEKGLFNWTVLAVNLAGLTTNTVSPVSYALAGFSQREVLSSATSLGAGLAPIGSIVSNPNNLSFENASEGGSGPNGGTIYSYQAYPNGTQLDNTYDVDNKFTVCDQNGLTNTNGGFVFNLDKLNRAANTSTSNPAKFIIEEN